MERTLTIKAPVLDTRSQRSQSAAVDRLAALFDAHQGRLYGLARRMSRDPEEARDLVQETFLRAARRPASIPESASGAEAWLVRVLVNLCRDRWRRLKVRQTAGPAPRWSVEEPANPEAAAEARASVQEALAKLRPRTRVIVVMHEIEGLGNDEIAKLLGISQATVRWHVATGRSRLRSELDPQGIRR